MKREIVDLSSKETVLFSDIESKSDELDVAKFQLGRFALAGFKNFQDFSIGIESAQFAFNPLITVNLDPYQAIGIVRTIHQIGKWGWLQIEARADNRRLFLAGISNLHDFHDGIYAHFYFPVELSGFLIRLRAENSILPTIRLNSAG